MNYNIEHRSQAYLNHLERMKKQKKEEDLKGPSEDDPVLGSFMKNLQSISVGDDSSDLFLIINIVF